MMIFLLKKFLFLIIADQFPERFVALFPGGNFPNPAVVMILDRLASLPFPPRPGFKIPS